MNRIPPIHPAPVRSFLSSPRVRVGSALVGLAGVLTLAGCSGAADAVSAGSAPVSTPGSSSPAATASPSSGTAAAGTTYRNGTYTGQGSYATPETIEKISVTVTLKDDVVTAVEVTGTPQARESRQYQSQFIGGIADAVVGKDIDSLSVGRVAGSSLTSGGFTKAIDQIKTEAKA